MVQLLALSPLQAWGAAYMKDLKISYFWTRYPVFSFLIWILIRLSGYYYPGLLCQHVLVVYSFFIVLTPLLYIVASQGILKGGGDSILMILASNVLRMVISLSLALVYIVKFRQQGTIFALDFFILYILFAVFEIHCLLHNLRLQKKENNSSNK